MHSYDPHTLQRRSLRDALWACSITLGGGVLFTQLEAVEAISPLVRRGEAFELDDLLLTACVAVVAATWFSWRRWRESLAQLLALRQSEVERGAYMARLEQLSSELLASDERARYQLAETLHDGVGQTLYAAKLKLELAASAAGTDAQSPLRQAHALLCEAMDATRDLTVELSPPVLRDLGLREAVQWLLQRLTTRYGFDSELQEGAVLDAVPEHFRAATFASIRELVVNAATHGRARNIRVGAQRDQSDVSIAVTDNGAGFDDTQRRHEGFGLFSVRRRLAWMRGHFELRSSAAGTCATLRIPARAQTAVGIGKSVVEIRHREPTCLWGTVGEHSTPAVDPTDL